MAEEQPPINTISLLGQAYSLLGFRIVDGVVGAGHPIKPSHSAVFAQIGPAGARLTELAAGAGITPQAMGEIVDELEGLGYVVRNPDPRDRRAKLITLTEKGVEVAMAGQRTIVGLEEDIVAVLGKDGHAQLREMLFKLLG
jgi:DNA-binding MarR family transcriptional regulator